MKVYHEKIEIYYKKFTSNEFRFSLGNLWYIRADIARVESSLFCESRNLIQLNGST
jgi:hypothetical protein